ncbi:hypothetical protein BYT27DRAFT_6406330 [Phlegmacium glaucopus]|nr:hypothetical protein BYT27DRAFT_6406330 [Phlegmacium glaucopus]
MNPPCQRPSSHTRLSSHTGCTLDDLLTIILTMSGERPSKRHRTDEVTPSSRKKLFHSPDPSTPSSMDVDPSSDNSMATTYAGTR